MNFDEIIVKESPGLCRCCLSEGCYKDLGSEYTWMNETEVYADMLLECFDISISQHSDGPNGCNRLICEVCITRLRDACNFKKQVVESEKKFIDLLAKGEFQPKVIVYDHLMKAENLETEELADAAEADTIEYLDDDMDYEDDLPLKQVLASAAASASDVTAEPIKIKAKRGRPKKSTMLKTEKRKEEKPRTSKAVVKDEFGPVGSSDRFASERRRNNLQILFNNTSIVPFKWRGRYLCFYCGQGQADRGSLALHTAAHGTCSTSDYALKTIKGGHIEIKIDVSNITCQICGEPFTKFDEIVDHLIGKHKLEYDKHVDIPFQQYKLENCQCLYCDESFAFYGSLVTHVNMFHPQSSFICDECGATFGKKQDLARHLRDNHKLGGYPCGQCSQVFETKNALTKHEKNYHFRKCKCCNASFSSYSLLQKHKQVDHPESQSHKCSFCSKELHSIQGLKQHLSKCKVKLLSTLDTPNTDCLDSGVEPKKKQNVKRIRENIICVLNMSTAVPFCFFAKYSCFHCARKFVEFEELKEHTILEHLTCDLKSKCIRRCKAERVSVKIDITSLSCKICCEPMTDFDTLVDHLVTSHNADYDKSVTGCFQPFRIVKDNLPCPVCGVTFRYFGILLRHINSDHNLNKYICDFCGRSFKSVTNLNVHISYAHRSIECDVCSMKFKNLWCLSRHKAKTHDVKDFKCPKCPEMFETQYQRQKHLIKIHDIGHKCGFCGRMFTRNSFMNDHVRRTHLKEKNVPCSVCNEKFFDNYLLRMHMVKHEGERRFACIVCGKAFLRRSNLNSHKEMHKKYGHVQTPI